eukprot:scaffold145278_cov40-Prasinocladus_malaysianus.AAC.1
MAQNTAWGLAQDLRAKIDAIVSNLIMSDDNDVKNIIKLLLANSNELIDNVNVTLNNIAINKIIRGYGNDATNLQLVDVLNSYPEVLDDIYSAITNVNVTIDGAQLNLITGGRENSATNDLEVMAGTFGSPLDVFSGMGRVMGDRRARVLDEFNGSGLGTDFTMEDVELTLQAIMMNKVARGQGNFLDNVLHVGMFNGVNAKDIKAKVEATLYNKNMDCLNYFHVAITTNQIFYMVRGGRFNDLSNLADIALGLCNGGQICTARDYALEVSASMVNDVTGTKNEILNMVKVTGAIGDSLISDIPSVEQIQLAGQSVDEFKKSVLDVEALIINTVRPGGLLEEVKSLKNKIKNQIEVETMINAKVEQVKVTVRGIINNTIKGSKNYLANVIKINAANGSPYYGKK